MKEKTAYNKGVKIIRSCQTGAHIIGAFNYIHNYRVMFGDTELFRQLWKYCTKRRKYCDK